MWLQILDHMLFLLFILIGRILQEKLDQPVSAPPSPREVSMEIDSPENMVRHIRFLKSEVERLKRSLRTTELHRESLSHYASIHSSTAQPLYHTTAGGKQTVLQIGIVLVLVLALVFILTVAHGIRTIYNSRLGLVLPN